MISVIAKKNETIDSMVRRFKKVCEQSGIMYDMRRKDYYEKPSIVKHRNKLAARRRNNVDWRQ